MLPRALAAVVAPLASALLATVAAGAASPGDTAPAANPARPRITGLAFVRFYADDIPAARHFYGTLLGLPESDTAGNTSAFAVGTLQRIEIAPTPANSPSHLAEVAFLTPDLPAMRRFLESNHLAVEPAGPDEIRTHDPEGNLIGFVRQGRAVAATKSASPAGRHTSFAAAGTPGAPTARRMIHAGFLVHSRDAENKFYLDLLGFRPYWYGGMHPDHTDWVSLQVPDGHDWVEYMLPGGSHSSTPDKRQLGVLDHASLGVEDIHAAGHQLELNGMSNPDDRKSQIGKDGKWQLNVFDPDLSRVEFMEFRPVQTPCCSAPTADPPSPHDLD